MPARRQHPGPVWEHPPPRAGASPLTRDQVVAAACTVADADGLEAVSVRRVASELGVGPMRLYGFFSTVDELYDLMADAAYGEIAAPEGLRGLAEGLRGAMHRHPWFADLLGGRPHLGPHALSHLEASLATAIADLPADHPADHSADHSADHPGPWPGTDGAPGVDVVADRAAQAVHTVTAYVAGAVRVELAQARVERATGQDERSWQAENGSYLERMFATGLFPTVERMVRAGADPGPDDVFVTGLEQVLAGIRRPGIRRAG